MSEIKDLPKVPVTGKPLQYDSILKDMAKAQKQQQTNKVNDKEAVAKKSESICFTIDTDADFSDVPYYESLCPQGKALFQIAAQIRKFEYVLGSPLFLFGSLAGQLEIHAVSLPKPKA